MTKNKVIGIDGWKKKWVAVFLTDGVFKDVLTYETLADAAADNPDAAAIGIDVPIGLPDVPPRLADREAAKFIGPRRSSVFSSPPKFCLDKKWTIYPEANHESRSRFGRGISAQGFALMANIREAAQLAARTSHVFEVHPEVSFCKMKDEQPLEFTKKSWNGQQERIELLEGAGIFIPEKLPGTAGLVSVDDILDAAAAAWSAHRIATNTAQYFPAKDETSGDLKIWY